jgi:hypothetical protein
MKQNQSALQTHISEQYYAKEHLENENRRLIDPNLVQVRADKSEVGFSVY